MAEILDYQTPRPAEKGSKLSVARRAVIFGHIAIVALAAAAGVLVVGNGMPVRDEMGIAMYVVPGLGLAGLSCLLAATGLAMALSVPSQGQERESVLTARWVNGSFLGMGVATILLVVVLGSWR